MRAHIVGGGFGGLAAAAYSSGTRGCPARTSRSTRRTSGWAVGSFSAAAPRVAITYLAPCSTRNFAAPSSCLSRSLYPSISVTDEFFAFNTGEPYHDRAHIFDRDGRIVHGPRFGLSLGDGLSIARVLLMPEAMLDGRRIEEFFSRRFFSTEFWFLWSTIMGSLPEHSAIEFRRYMNRFLTCSGTCRT